MKMHKKLVFLICLLVHFGSLKAQKAESPDRAWLLGAGVGMNSAQGDWSEFFGTNFTIGANLGRKFKSNYTITAEWDFLFGSDIPNRLGVLSSTLTADGNVLNLNGSYAQVNINQRGSISSLGIEKTFPFIGPNPNSGLIVGLYGGYTWHWLNVDNAGNDSPQLLDEYAKGYDRLSSGPHLRQSIGFMHLSDNRLVNFRISLELTEIWSRDLRGYFYPTGQLSDDLQLNLLYSIKLRWYIPIYLGGKKQEYYYD